MNLTDGDAWSNCNIEDLWIFDKLIISKKSGYLCGPRGLPVPKPDFYFVKPIMNINGMGERARVEYLEQDTSNIHPSEFWCEIFTGEHISIDYKKYKPILSVVGTKHKNYPYSRFARWEITEKTYPLPKFIGSIPLRYKTINCEFIDGNLIEVHLRPNPDFAYGNTLAIPVWKDEDDTEQGECQFIDDKGEELNRRGIWIK